MSAMEIIELRTLPDEIGVLLSESERSGFRFLRRLVTEWESGRNRFDGRGEGLFGARVSGRLVGICGLNIDPYENDMAVGRIRRLYVLDAYRRMGVGRSLIEHVACFARLNFRQLQLRSDTAAVRFYEHLGFQAIVSGSATHAWSFGEAERSGA
ncbi:MAG: GNAT family N-acetyltransferase [Acidobacteria bacterium]|nr:MAG: GNAT family N-acetyltransferase [Acidobacteriota bacterium]